MVIQSKFNLISLFTDTCIGKMEDNGARKRKSQEDLQDITAENGYKKFKDSKSFDEGKEFLSKSDYFEGTEEYDVVDNNDMILEGSANFSDKTEEYSKDNSQHSYGDLPLENDNRDTNDNTKGENATNCSSDFDADMQPAAEAKTKLLKHESVQRDAKAISEIVQNVDIGILYDKVLKVRKEGNRVDIVTNEILENMDIHEQEDMAVSESSSSDDIFKDVAEVLVKCPNADPSKVYDMLSGSKDVATRVESVISELSESNVSKSSSNAISTKVTNSGESVDLFADPDFKSNPLYKDVKTLYKVMPDKDPNELYAYLEAHFDKPNRIQIVIDELTKSDSQESLPAISKSSSFGKDVNKGKAPLTTEDKLQTDLNELKVVFPDCDPNFLFEKLEEKPNDPERVGKIAYDLFESKKYPKLSEILEKERKEQIKRKYKKMEFILGEFLQKFPNPFEFFSDEDRIVGDNYKEHVLAYLKNTYPYAKDGFIKKVLEEHKHHLNPAVLQIETDMMDITGKNKLQYHIQCQSCR